MQRKANVFIISIVAGILLLGLISIINFSARALSVQEYDLFQAIEARDFNRVRALVKAGVKLNVQNDIGDTPLHVAVKVDSLPIVRYLIENGGADKNAKGNNDNTPLHIASAQGDIAIVQYLVGQQSVNKNPVNRDQLTPLGLALITSKSVVSDYLRDNGGLQ